VKPAKIVVSGEEFRIRRGEVEFVVIVQGISGKRRPAKEAQLLYEETEASMLQREEMSHKKRLEAAGKMVGPMKRPDKRRRRQKRSFTGKE